MRSSIKLKSTLFLAVLLALTLGITGVIVLKGIEANQQQRYEELLSQQANIASLYIQQSYAAQERKAVQDYLSINGIALARHINRLIGTHVVLYDMSGKEIGNSAPGLSARSTEDTLSYALQGKVAYQVSGQTVYYLSPIEISGAQAAVVQLYYSLADDYSFYNNMRSLFISIGGLIFILSFISGYFYFNRMTNAIYKLKSAVNNIKQGSYHDIPEVNRRDELGDLRQGIYYMSSQIERSIEDMKEEQRKLELALDKLRALEQQQRQFIGNVTHEFKTPLTVIKAYLDLMEMYPEDQELARDAKSNISREALRLQEMVEKALELAALERYDFEIKLESIDIAEVLTDICSRMDGKAKKLGLTLYKDIKAGRLLADRESLFQIFINLIDNAIKYNRPGGSIAVKSYTQNDRVNVEISDTGIGIPKEAVDKVFEAFYRVDKDRSRATGGTGLGLALVKELVEKQKGTIAITDTGEHGTTFLITFPLIK